MNKPQSDYKMKIEFYDLDPMNVVWHGNYVKFLEAARCDFLEKVGCTYSDFKNAGFAYPVAKMEMKYIKPCVFGQEIIVKVILEELEPALKFKYIISDFKTGEKLFVAKTMQLCIDINTKDTLYEAPSLLKEKINEYKN